MSILKSVLLSPLSLYNTGFTIYGVIARYNITTIQHLPTSFEGTEKLNNSVQGMRHDNDLNQLITSKVCSFTFTYIALHIN